MDTGNQTIAGEKTFTSKLTVGDTNKTTFLADNDVVIEKEGTTFGFWGGKGTTSQGTLYRFYGTDSAINYFTIDTTQATKHYIKSTAGTLGFDNLNIETNGWVKFNSGTANQFLKIDANKKLETTTLSASDLSDNNTIVKTDDVRIDKISTTSTTNPDEFKYIFDLSSTNKTYQTYEFKGNNNLIAVFSEITNMFYGNIELLSTKHFTYGYGTANQFLKLDANKKMISTTIASTDLSDSGDIVMDTGNQTIAGVKTFSSPIKVPNGTVMESAGNMRFWSNKDTNSGGEYEFTGMDSIDNHLRITTGSTSTHYIVSSTGNINFLSNDLLTYGDITADGFIGGTIKLTDGASVGKFLKCTNADGTSEWADAPGGGGVSGNISVDNIVTSTGSITTTDSGGINFGDDNLTSTGTLQFTGGAILKKGDFGMQLHDTASNTNIPIIIGEDPGTTYADDGTVACFVGDTSGSHRVSIRNLQNFNAILKLQQTNYAFGLASLNTGSFGLFDYQNNNYKLFYNYSNGFDFTDREVKTTGKITGAEISCPLIKSTTGAISFDDESLTTTGAINGGSATITGTVNAGSLLTSTISPAIGSSLINFGTADLSTSGDLSLTGLTGNQFLKLNNLTKVTSTTIASTDLSDTSNIVLLDTTQVITGQKTFSGLILLSGITANKFLKVNALSQLTSVDLEIDDLDDSANVVTRNGTQTITGTKTFDNTISGSVSGNAGTATILQTARTIAGKSFNGSANISIASTDLSDSGDIVMDTGNQTIAGDKTFSGDCTFNEAVRFKLSLLGSMNVPISNNEFKTVLKPSDFMGDDDDGSTGVAQSACVFDSTSTSTGYPQSFGGVRIDTYGSMRPDLVCQYVIPYGATATHFRINLKNYWSTSGLNMQVKVFVITTDLSTAFEEIESLTNKYCNSEVEFQSSSLSQRTWSSSVDKILLFHVFTNNNGNTISGGYIKWAIP